MKKQGRIIAIGAILSVHVTLTSFNVIKYGSLALTDLIATPLIILFAYWAGFNYDKAVFYSEKDSLTGLFNRRSLVAAFDKIASLADRTHTELFLLVIDCDNFKSVNDIHGHQQGDLVLREISKVLVGTTRNSDLVARWGGDEFLVIGHYKGEEGLRTMLRRIETELQAMTNPAGIDVQVSIGSSLYPQQGQRLDQLIKLADESMYKTKYEKRRS